MTLLLNALKLSKGAATKNVKPIFYGHRLSPIPNGLSVVLFARCFTAFKEPYTLRCRPQRPFSLTFSTLAPLPLSAVTQFKHSMGRKLQSQVSVRHFSIHVELTPNPNAKMYFPDSYRLLPEDAPDTISFDQNYNENTKGPKSPLAEVLLKLEGVYSVLLCKTYVTVVKRREADWKVLDGFIVPLLEEFIKSERPSFTPAAAPSPKILKKPEEATADANSIDSDLEDIIESIKVLLDTRARPMIQDDGGDIEFIRFDEDQGIVWIYMKGACDGCPSSAGTLQEGIATMLKYFIPEVNQVKQCDENGDPLIENEEDMLVA